MKIKREIFEIRGAALEGLNPLPKFRARKMNDTETSDNFPECLKESIGCQTKVLPYLRQDRYSRKRDVLKLKSFVLENEYLVARFLPEFGGRLHSLFDKKKRARPVVYQHCNPALQYSDKKRMAIRRYRVEYR